jgi:hypothetical protein
MVSITISVPAETRELMDRFPEMDWSEFVRKSIVDEVERLKLMDGLRMKPDNDFDDWAVELVRAGRSGRLDELKRKGLI